MIDNILVKKCVLGGIDVIIILIVLVDFFFIILVLINCSVIVIKIKIGIIIVVDKVDIMDCNFVFLVFGFFI